MLTHVTAGGGATEFRHQIDEQPMQILCYVVPLSALDSVLFL